MNELDFSFPMKHPENEFSQNHSLKRLSCSAASGIKPNNMILNSKQLRLKPSKYHKA